MSFYLTQDFYLFLLLFFCYFYCIENRCMETARCSNIVFFFFILFLCLTRWALMDETTRPWAFAFRNGLSLRARVNLMLTRYTLYCIWTCDGNSILSMCALLFARSSVTTNHFMWTCSAILYLRLDALIFFFFLFFILLCQLEDLPKIKSYGHFNDIANTVHMILWINLLIFRSEFCHSLLRDLINWYSIR